jgi:hypothetical protein
MVVVMVEMDIQIVFWELTTIGLPVVEGLVDPVLPVVVVDLVVEEEDLLMILQMVLVELLVYSHSKVVQDQGN